MRRFLLASLVLALALCHWAGSASAADDTTPPTLVSATRYSTNLFSIFVSFSERMNTNTTLAPTNYTLKSGAVSGNIIDSDIAFGTAGTGTNRGINYILTTDIEVDMDREWVLTAKNVADTNGNVIVSTANANTILVRTVESLIAPYSDSWDFLDYGYDSTAAQLFDNSWAQPEFVVDSSWNAPAGFQKSATFYTAWGGGLTPPGGGTTLCCYPNIGGTDTEVPSTTAYFRKTFTVGTGSLFNSTFAIRALVNDGAVFYLNGKEFFRTNIAATVTPTYKTLANKAGANTFGPFITVPINANILFGDNLLAVELHQKAAQDTDAAFDVEITQSYTNRAVGAATIFLPPQDLTVVEGTPALFSVQPDGKPAYKYQWYRIPAGQTAGTKLANETNRLLTINPTPISYNGSKIYVEVTAATGGVKASTNALLTVTSDKVAPTLVSAIVSPTAEGTNVIVVTFSEFMNLATATNKANYTVTSSAGQAPTLSSITNINGRSVALIFNSPLLSTTRYTVTPKNLTDNASVPNALADSQVSVGGTFGLIDLEGEWRFYQNATNPPVGATWTLANYSEVDGWQTGNGLFYVEDADLPATKNTSLSLKYNNIQVLTYYFRNTFNFGGSTNNVNLVVNHVVDDGMVVWLNGQVAYRFNMPASPATPLYSTLASTSVDNAVLVEGIKLPLTNIVQGVNQLAVEVHQQTATSTDVVFGLGLDEVITSVVTTTSGPRPTIAIAKSADGKSAVLSWPASTGYVLQSTTKLSPATWTDVAGATATGYTVALNANAVIYYRLNKP